MTTNTTTKQTASETVSDLFIRKYFSGKFYSEFNKNSETLLPINNTLIPRGDFFKDLKISRFRRGTL